MSHAEQLARIRSVFEANRVSGIQSTHWEGCEDYHWACGVAVLLEEVTRLAEEQERLQKERDALRSALVGLVGVDGREELEQLEVGMRLVADKAALIDAIHALMSTLAVRPGEREEPKR